LVQEIIEKYSLKSSNFYNFGSQIIFKNIKFFIIGVSSANQNIVQSSEITTGNTDYWIDSIERLDIKYFTAFIFAVDYGLVSIFYQHYNVFAL